MVLRRHGSSSMYSSRSAVRESSRRSVTTTTFRAGVIAAPLRAESTPRGSTVIGIGPGIFTALSKSCLVKGFFTTVKRSRRRVEWRESFLGHDGEVVLAK